MFAEVIYETGTKSVMQIDTEDELLQALRVHHLRAVSGQPGGPAGHTAERIKLVEIYDKHPQDLNEVQVIGTDVAKKEVTNLISELDSGSGSISIVELAGKIRELSSPLVDDAAPHESMYKMPSRKTLTSGWEDGK